MSGENTGVQELSVEWKQAGTSARMNKLLEGIIRPGLYQPIALSKVSGANKIFISKTQNGVNGWYVVVQTLSGVVKIKFTADTLASNDITPSAPWIVIHYEHMNAVNYAEIRALAYDDIGPNDVIVGKCNFTGNTLDASKFDYSQQQLTELGKLYNNADEFEVRTKNDPPTVNTGVTVRGGSITVDGITHGIPDTDFPDFGVLPDSSERKDWIVLGYATEGVTLQHVQGVVASTGMASLPDLEIGQFPIASIDYRTPSYIYGYDITNLPLVDSILTNVNSLTELKADVLTLQGSVDILEPKMATTISSVNVLEPEMATTIASVNLLGVAAVSLDGRLDAAEPVVAKVTAYQPENRMHNTQFKIDYTPRTLSTSQVTFARNWTAHFTKNGTGGQVGAVTLTVGNVTSIGNVVTRRLQGSCYTQQVAGTGQTENSITLRGRAYGAQWMTGAYHVSCYMKTGGSMPNMTLKAYAQCFKSSDASAIIASSPTITLGTVTSSWTLLEGIITLPAVTDGYGDALGYSEISFVLDLGTGAMAAGNTFEFALPQVIAGNTYAQAKKLTYEEEALRMAGALTLQSLTTTEGVTAAGQVRGSSVVCYGGMRADGDIQSAGTVVTPAVDLFNNAFDHSVGRVAVAFTEGDYSDLVLSVTDDGNSVVETARLNDNAALFQGQLQSKKLPVATDTNAGTTFTPMMIDDESGASLRLIANVDLNTISVTGRYNVYTTLTLPNIGGGNRPITGWWFLEVNAHTSSYVEQKACSFAFSFAGTQNRYFYRHRSNGTWTEWVEWTPTLYRPRVSFISIIRRAQVSVGSGYESRIYVAPGCYVSMVDGKVLHNSWLMTLNNTVTGSTGEFLYVYFYDNTTIGGVDQSLGVLLSKTAPAKLGDQPIWIMSGNATYRYSGCYFMFYGSATTALRKQIWHGTGDGAVHTSFAKSTTGSDGAIYKHVTPVVGSSGAFDLSDIIPYTSEAADSNLVSIDVIVSIDGVSGGTYIHRVCLRGSTDWGGVLSAESDTGLTYMVWTHIGKGTSTAQTDSNQFTFTKIPLWGYRFLTWYYQSGANSTPQKYYFTGVDFKW